MHGSSYNTPVFFIGIKDETFLQYYKMAASRDGKSKSINSKRRQWKWNFAIFKFWTCNNVTNTILIIVVLAVVLVLLIKSDNEAETLLQKTFTQQTFTQLLNLEGITCQMDFERTM